MLLPQKGLDEHSDACCCGNSAGSSSSSRQGCKYFDCRRKHLSLAQPQHHDATAKLLVLRQQNLFGRQELCQILRWLVQHLVVSDAGTKILGGLCTAHFTCRQHYPQPSCTCLLWWASRGCELRVQQKKSCISQHILMALAKASESAHVAVVE